METSSTTTGHKALHIALWVAQIALAALFAFAGGMKLSMPLAELTEASGLPGGLIRFIGIAEIAGVLGLILPALTRILPKLTALAALALAVVMVLAIGFHLSRGEAAYIGIPVAAFLLALFVAWGRYAKAPIAPRG